jgi:hypothetical protein
VAGPLQRRDSLTLLVGVPLSALNAQLSDLLVVPRARNLPPETVGKDSCQESREAREEQDGD